MTWLQPLTAAQAADLLEVVEDRAQRRSTVVTSQLPIAQWHGSLGEPTVADAILDRLVNNAHRLELRGESLRRSKEPVATLAENTAVEANGPDQPKAGSREGKRAATKLQDARK